ncbi:hypothetical protein [Streptomyces mirabilis]
MDGFQITAFPAKPDGAATGSSAGVPEALIAAPEALVSAQVKKLRQA